jgi:diaminopimelate decarboxylase
MTTRPRDRARALDRRAWGLDVNANDHLVLGGCDLVTLAGTYGTPLHVVHEDRVRDNYRRFARAFQDASPATRIFYSYKTNCIPAVLALLHAEGCGAEVVSPYEAWVARALGVEGADVVYNGVGRSADDFGAAIDRRVGLINVDSVRELRAVAQAADDRRLPVRVGLRIAPGVGWRAHFGLHPGVDGLVDRVAELKGHRYVTLYALHAHVGSGLRETATHARVIGALCALRRELARRSGFVVSCLGLGGGFGVPTVKTLSLREAALYKLCHVQPRPPRLDGCPSIDAFGQAVTAALREHGARSGLEDPVLHLEPGRALTSDAQVLLTTVKDVKARRASPPFAVTDASMQAMAFPLAYEYHHPMVASRAGAPRDRRYSVTGPLCSPEDLLYRGWRLPELAVGDVLAIMDAGAYFTSFANNFSYPRPAVVGVSAGRHRLLRARETFEQMTAADALHSWTR